MHQKLFDSLYNARKWFPDVRTLLLTAKKAFLFLASYSVLAVILVIVAVKIECWAKYEKTLYGCQKKRQDIRKPFFTLIGSGYLTVPYRQIRNYLAVRYRQIRNYMTVPIKKG